MTKVMVYGTLKNGYGNHHILGDSKFISEAVTEDNSYTMYNGGFPFVSDRIDDGNQGRIIGELYEVVDKNIENALDRLEGVPYMYVRHRTVVTTIPENNRVENVLMYVASEGTNDRLRNRDSMSPDLLGDLEWK